MLHLKNLMPASTVLIAAAAITVALGGTAGAALLVSGKQIVDGSVTSRDVKNTSLSGADVRDASLSRADFTGSVQGPAGPVGPTGPGGPTGPQGAAGDRGPTGVAGPAGIAGATGAVGPQGPAGVTGLTYQTNGLTKSGIGLAAWGVPCPDGTRALGGGLAPTQLTSQARVLTSRPAADGLGWSVAIVNSADTPVTYYAWVACGRLS